jgi:glycosyltransferase involved in cell wall biosynthesis
MLSLITITFQNDDEFEETLSSIESVDFLTELVVIDGGVSERVRKACDFSRLNVNLIQEMDEGIYDAFNKGALAAKGKYICYLNSGDKLIDGGEYYKAAVAFLEENDNHFFTHSNILFSDSTLGSYLMKPKFGNIGKGILTLHPSLIVKNSVLQEIGLFNKRYKIAADYDFILRLTKNFKGIYLDGFCPVDMDGSGVSSNQEYRAILECGRILRANSASWTEYSFFVLRYLKFCLRSLLDRLGLRNLKDKLRSIGKEKRKSP